MPLFSKFFPPNVIAYTSDRSVDFALPRNHHTLNKAQKDLLSSQLAKDLPEPVFIRQIHSDQIINVIGDFRSPQKEADGLITKIPLTPLAIRTADCLPVFFYDPRQEGIGMVHVGWRGAQKKIVPRAVEMMQQQWSTDPKNITIVFGPAIHSCCYEVSKEFNQYFPKEVEMREDRYYLDLPRVVEHQLIVLGVGKENIRHDGICTCCNENYFSYRREGEKTGRMISLIALMSKGGT